MDLQKLTANIVQVWYDYLSDFYETFLYILNIKVMTTKSKIILGLVGAAAAGVIVGLVLAPEKGTDFRRKIKDTAGDWADQLTDLFATAKSEIDNLKGKASREARSMANDAGNKFGNMKESYS
jgi:gas vesicle protein